MTEWAERRHFHDLEWRMERAEAEVVDCTEPGCEAVPGETCRNLDDGLPLGRLPAHHRRMTAARAAASPSIDEEPSDV